MIAGASPTGLQAISTRPHLVRTLQWSAQCFLLWLGLLIALTAVGMMAVYTAQFTGEMAEGYVPATNVGPGVPPGLWMRWDAHYYLEIARDGYEPHPETRGFFPFYPLLIGRLSSAIGCGHAFSGMLIAQLSFLVAILAFYKLARLIHDDHTYAMWAVAFMAVFPSAFFYFALYAEALYLACAIIGVYLIMRTRPLYVRSGFTLALASLTRPVGWLLNVIIVVEYWFRRKTDRPLSLWRTLITLLLSAGGTVAFVLYLYKITGTVLAVTEAQANWRRHWNWPWLTVWSSIKIAFTGSRVPGDWFLYAINWTDLLFALFALVLTGVAVYRSFRRRFPWALTLYLITSLLFTLSSEGPYLAETSRLVVVPLWGTTRWVAALFPLFLLLPQLVQNRYARWGLALVSTGLLFGFTAWWTTGRWVG